MQAAGTTNTIGYSTRGGAGFLIPAAIHLIRSSAGGSQESQSLALVSSGPPKAFVDNAHRLVQGVLALLPRSLLYWFCSKVLSLSSETADTTVEHLKSRETLWQILNRHHANTSPPIEVLQLEEQQ